VHLGQPPGHDVVERRHAVEQRDVLECPGDALPGDLVRLQWPALLAMEPDLAFLRVVKAVDDIQHRRLAGPVRADDGADLALADIEADILDRGDAAEALGDVLHLHHHSADLARVQPMVDFLMGVIAVVFGCFGHRLAAHVVTLLTRPCRRRRDAGIS
jgi:hypothetical protein